MLNKDFGQHLLVNPLVVNGIIEKVGARRRARPSTPVTVLNLP